ncbi:hypothetical protein AAFF_G00133830 [Aldrovandia affinis]|uniref:Mitogen-activated protein kinase kinase kinase 19 n=1 Tax=Aldrovandia affinis TaxID=143900 RepID=A0AAD7RQL0_9TELE|nr:hypothetical protein AAFF_G00133830 [Aldrovandia affinis]
MVCVSVELSPAFRPASCLDGRDRLCLDSHRLFGEEATKRRHLRQLGIEVVQIPYFEFYKLGTRKRECSTSIRRGRCWARPGHPSPQAQLLSAAWQGDLHSLQNLLVQTDRVDVNTQNRDGLTPLMLAMRDVDLFEGLGALMDWEYRPVEVVQELLGLQVALDACDHRGRCAMHYAARVKSALRDELVQLLLESLLQSGSDPDCFDPEEPSGSSPSSPLTHSFLVQAADNTEGLAESSESVSFSQSRKPRDGDRDRLDRLAFGTDARISLSFHAAAETLTDMRQEYQELEERSSRCTSLPSLWDRGRRGDKLCALDTGQGLLKMMGRSCLPAAPPRATGRGEAAPPSLAGPHPPQLIQSAPVLMEPLLDSVSLLRVRAHIQTRLGGSEPDAEIHGRRTAQDPQTPGPTGPGAEGRGVPLGCRHPSPLRPIALLPTAPVPTARRERLSRRCPGARGARGSEESSSSSLSSQGSLELDEEEEKEEDEEEEEEEDTERTCDDRDINVATGSTFSDTEKGWAVTEKGKTSPRQTATCSPVPEEDRDTATETAISQNDLKSQDTKNTGLLVVNITVSETDALLDGKSSPAKTNKNKEKGSIASFHTNQSFNVLAYKDHSRFARRLKSNQRSVPRPSPLKANVRNPQDLLISGEASVKPCAPRTGASKASPKTTTTPLLRNRSTEQLRPVARRPSAEKGNSNKLEALARKQSLQRDLKCARQPKKGATPGTPRAKSAVDFVTYSDMFQEINRGDDGPAIYEMFATPVYDNLRASTSSVRVSPRQVQSAPARKSQGRRNHKSPKPLENGRQKKAQRERDSPASGRHRKRSDVLLRGKPHRPLVGEEERDNVVLISGINWHIKATKSDSIFYAEDSSTAPEGEEEAEQALSVIEEVLSNYLSETRSRRIATEDRSPPASPEPPEEITHRQTPIDRLPAHDDKEEGPTGNRLHNDRDCEEPEASSSGSFPRQPMRNTWTSGSSDRTMSSMFRKYLDVAGEGPLTDDLLQCLAEELISLEEGEVTLHPNNRTLHHDGTREASQQENGHPLPEGITSPVGESSATGLCAEDAVLWTKGEVLGRGAYGTVYCGLTSQGQLIAVKQVVLDDSDPESGAREYQRLQDEMDLLKTLRHPNIVGFLGTTLRDGVVSIFMEYVPGGSIASIIHRFGPLPERVLALYTRQILDGVAHLHQNRVIHRDLKGNNVMLMPTGVIKLIDFGCARRLSYPTHCASSSSSSSSEVLRSVHGTPYWMAPEVINETGHGRKSDIWSVGCTVFEMATGRPPLAHMDKVAALFYIGARRGLMPTLSDEFSEDARNFVQACLTSDQKDRPSAEELLLHPFISQKCAGILLQQD